MARKSSQQICAEIDALNVSLKQPISYSEDEPYDVLLDKLKKAQGQLEEKPTPELAKVKVEHVSLGKGCDEYGRAINKLMDAVFNK